MMKKKRCGFVVIVVILMWNTAMAAPLPDFISIVNDNYRAVVNISTIQPTSKVVSRPLVEIPGVDENTPLHDFLRYLLKPSKPSGPKNRGYNERSLGSGFIISSDGYILTNAHVVEGAAQIIVTLSDHREFPAELIGKDGLTDVAVLKIDESDLPSVQTDSVSRLEVGQWVLAIGSPFGLDHTASQGIVSALGRSLPHESYVPFIQTDVAINPGNSGGPLFNTAGSVVGVNSQIYTRSGGSIGLSFAIPIRVALDVAEQLKLQGEVRRGWLGLSTQDLTQDLALSFGLEIPTGVLVAGIVYGSPAEEAGIVAGDILIEYNQIPVDRSANLMHLLGVTKINTNVPVKLIRDGETLVVGVKITELTQHTATRLALAESGDLIIKWLNLKIGDLTEDQREYMKIPHGGTLVKSISRGKGAKSGIHKADVILKVANQRVENAKHFEKLIAEQPEKKPIALLIQRRNGPIFLSVSKERVQ